MDLLQKLNDYRTNGISDNYTERINDKVVLKVKFQQGGTADNERNGVFIEDLLIAAHARLNGYNKEFPSRENSLALTNIEQAILWLIARKAERDYRGVYGKEVK